MLCLLWSLFICMIDWEELFHTMSGFRLIEYQPFWNCVFKQVWTFPNTQQEEESSLFIVLLGRYLTLSGGSPRTIHHVQRSTHMVSGRELKSPVKMGSLSNCRMMMIIIFKVCLLGKCFFLNFDHVRTLFFGSFRLIPEMSDLRYQITSLVFCMLVFPMHLPNWLPMLKDDNSPSFCCFGAPAK